MKTEYYKNYEDVLEDLNISAKYIEGKDEEYFWWIGNIDGLKNCNFITWENYHNLMKKLDKAYKEGDLV